MHEFYNNALREATDVLLAALLENDEPLRQSGRGLDRSVFVMLMTLGRMLLAGVYDAMGERLIREAAPLGLRVERRPRVSFTTLFGPLQVGSPYLRDRATKASDRPLKRLFGVRGLGCSDAVERALCDFGSDRSFSRAASAMQEHYGLEVDRSSILRRTEALGERAEAYLDARLERAKASYTEPPARAPRAEAMVVELDGCHLPVGAFMSAAEAGRADLEPDQLVRVDAWVEARTGLARGLEEVEKTYVCRQAKYAVICEQLYGAACERGLGPETRVIAPGDGGNGLREGLEVVFARLEFRLDPTHLRDDFFKCAEGLGLERPERASWVRAHLAMIWEGRLGESVEQLRELREAQKGALDLGRYHAVRRLLEYIEAHDGCLDYAAYKEEGTPMGSGEVESAHKSVPQERLKIPGARWRRDHINPMLALRVIRANGWWSEFWDDERERRAAA